MPREVFTKVAADANGTWTRHTGDVTFATAGLTRGVLHDFSDGLTTVQVTPFGPPLPIDPAKISISDPADGTGLDVTLAADYVDAQGSAPTDLEYEVDDSDTWVSWGSAAPGTYKVPIAALTLGASADIQVRARNASATPGAELATALTETPTSAAPAWPIGLSPYAGWNTGTHTGFDGSGVLTISDSSTLFFGFDLNNAGGANTPLISGATYRFQVEILEPASGSIAGDWRLRLGNVQYESSAVSSSVAVAFAAGQVDFNFVAGSTYDYSAMYISNGPGNARMRNFSLTYVSGP